MLQAAAALGLAQLAGWGWAYAITAATLMALAVAIVARTYPPGRPFGSANRVTLVRLALAMLLAAALVPAAVGVQIASQVPLLAWGLVCLAAVGALLDAVDGPLARRLGTASAYGARFDMEADAWFTLVLCALAWQLDRAGAWVLASGLMRYAFVAAAWALPWLAQPLPPSRRRQVVCAVQIVALIVALAPVWPRSASSAICAFGLALLAASFAADVVRLGRIERRRRHAGATSPQKPAARDASSSAGVLRCAAAAFVLNTLFTFESGLGGIGVQWSPRLSFELVVAVLVGIAWFAWRGTQAPLSRRAVRLLACAAFVLALARFIDVTVPAFFGRPVNLYWDAPHAWQLLKLAWSAWPAWAVLGAALAVLLMLIVGVLVLIALRRFDLDRFLGRR